MAKKEKPTLKPEETAKEVAEELFKKLEITASVKASFDEEKNLIIEVEGEELGILIGKYGQTLKDLQFVLGSLINKKLGEEWQRVLLDIGGWRKAREESLRLLAKNAAERARFKKEPVSLPPMDAFDRRIIHLSLAAYPDLTSESEGEGEERKVIVKPK